MGCRIQSDSEKGGLMDWELVEQLEIQASVGLDRGPKRWFSEKRYAVTIRKGSEWIGGSHDLTRQ